MNMHIPFKTFALSLLVCAAGSTLTGFTNVAYLNGSYDATQPLANGMVYFVTNSVTFEGGYDGKSGLAVAPGAEVVISVQEDCRLTAKGKSGETGGAGDGGSRGPVVCNA